MSEWRRRLRSLPVQLVGLMSLALLPLGLISLYQTRSVLEEARTLNRASLKGRTIEAAMAERELIQEALGAAQGLSAAISLDDAGGCTALMKRFVDLHPQFIHAGFVRADGVMECSSAGVVRDFAGTPEYRAAIAADGRSVEINRRGAITGRSVVLVRYQLRLGNEVLGYTTISIPHSVANALMTTQESGAGLLLATINRNGELVSASGSIDDAQSFLPREVPLQELFRRAGETFDAVSGDGTSRVFSVSSMVPGDVVLVGSWPGINPWRPESLWRGWVSLTFPVLMWAAGILVAYFGVQRLVIRHIGALRSAMRKYALGDLEGGRLELDNPPEELQDTERAFNRMVLFLAQAEAQKEQDLRDKEVLLREVHHRVKNNLQLIASIMNMQGRAARTPEARQMLAGLQRRVRGLAMLHRTLYTSPEYTTVDAEELIDALVKDLTSAAGIPGVEITMQIEPVRLFPDQAVPLSMLLAEALTNAIKHVGASRPDTEPLLSITLDKDAASNRAVLAIENTKGAPPKEDASNPQIQGLGSRLMAAFVSQLEGVAHVEETSDIYRYEVAFILRDFEAEPPADSG